ncbi:hypothetical protein P7C70_g8542, partial [Phenoliferia sp. Uapishka_3]
MASYATSSSLSMAESAFTSTSASTACTTYEDHFFGVPRSTSIRLPLHLPPRPLSTPDVELSALIVDPEFQDLPLGFVIAKLRELGPELLRATQLTHIDVPTSTHLPSHIRCSFPPPSFTRSSAYLLPSHILAIRCSDVTRTLLLPVQGLMWAAMSPGLSLLSSSPNRPSSNKKRPRSPATSTLCSAAELSAASSLLPVVQITLPSNASIRILQSYVTMASTSDLYTRLLPLPPSSPSTLANILNQPSHEVTPSSLAIQLSQLPSKTLLDRVKIVHGLWQNVVALEITDEGMWEVMSNAWSILIAALALRDQRKAAPGGSGRVPADEIE